jgi:hypothetical protein
MPVHDWGVVNTETFGSGVFNPTYSRRTTSPSRRIGSDRCATDRVCCGGRLSVLWGAAQVPYAGECNRMVKNAE